MREIATDIRVAVLYAITPLVVSTTTIPVRDTFMPPSVTIPDFQTGKAYVLLTDQSEAETTNNDCSIRQSVNFNINIVTKFPVGSGGKKASELISNAIQLKMTEQYLILPGDLQLLNIRKTFSRVQIEQGSTEIAYQKILGYTFDIFQVS